MNEVEEFYLQHYGAKGMKWGVRRKRDSTQRQVAKQAKKANKAMYKEAKRDIKSWDRAKATYNKDLVSKVDQNIESKRANNKGYDQAYGKAKKSYNRNVRANRIAALAMASLSVAHTVNPEAVYKGAGVVASVLGEATSSAGMYAKYAAKAAVPVSRTVKNRGYIDAILVNSGNALKVVG